MDSLLDWQAVAERTSLGRTSVLDMMRSGEIRSIRVGRRRLVRSSDLDTWIESLTDADTTPGADGGQS